MTKFVISADSAKRVLTLSNQSKEIISMTKTVFAPSEKGLNVNLYSPRNALSFTTDITSFETDKTEGLNFFSMPIEDFTNALVVASKTCSIDVGITIDESSNKITFKNPETSITKNITNNVVSDEEAKASITAVEDLKEAYFKNPVNVTITNDVINFYESANKFMNQTKTQNTIAVDKDRAFYADSLVVIEKKLSKDVSDRRVHLNKQLLENIKPFLRLSEEITVSLTEDCKVACFESPETGYKAVFTLEEIRYTYPTDEDLVGIVPSSDRQIKVLVKKDALRESFIPFTSIFKSNGDNWSWKDTTLISDKKNLDEGKLVLRHHDYTGEVESKLPVTIVSNTENAETSNITISIMCFEELLGLITEDNFTITYNSLSPNEEHGVGVLIETDTLKAVSVKFRSAI